MWKLIKHSLTFSVIITQLIIIGILLRTNGTGNLLYMQLVSSVKCSDQINALKDELYRCKKTLYDVDNIRERRDTYENCLQCIQDSFVLVEKRKSCEKDYDELYDQLLLKNAKDTKCAEKNCSMRV